MIVYNITCHIERSINAVFITWVKNELLLRLKSSDFVIDTSFLKVLTEFDENSFAYSIQVLFVEMAYYNQFQLKEELKLMEEIQNKFKGKIFTFTTLLEHI